MTTISLAFWRDLGTFLCLYTGLRIRRPHYLAVERRDLPWFCAMGVISVAFLHVMWNTTVLVNGVSVASVIETISPVFVSIMAWLFWRESLTGRKIIAVVVAGLGIALISGAKSLDEFRVTPQGLAVGLVHALAYGSYSLFGKKLVTMYSPWTVLLYAFGFASLSLLPFQFALPLPWPVAPRTLLDLAAFVTLSTVTGFALYTSGLRLLPSSVASIIANTEFLFAASLAYFALGERLDRWQILGALLVLAGVTFVSIPHHAGEATPPSTRLSDFGN